MKQTATIEAGISIVKQDRKVAVTETEVGILKQGDLIFQVCDKEDANNYYFYNVHFRQRTTPMT